MKSKITMKKINLIIVLVALLIMVGCDKVVYLPIVTDELTVKGNAVTFLFEVDKGDEGYMPKLEYDTDPNFLNSVVIFADVTTNKGQYTVALEGLEPYTTYYYRYLVSNSAGGTILVNNNSSFSTAEAVELSIGQLPGRFSVSEDQKVYFSQGNLQYHAAYNIWRFANNQYDCIGEGNHNISENYDDWIDLFGWATSGYPHGTLCYQPWSTNPYGNEYGWGGIYGGYTELWGDADWGYNPINNGGNEIGTWRTLKKDEWVYLLLNRNTLNGIRFAKAKLNNVNGLLLLPDDWNADAFPLNNTDDAASTFSSNMISLNKWKDMEGAGAVFLPAAGGRDERTVVDFDKVCYYWSASENISGGVLISGIAYAVGVNDEELVGDYSTKMCYGLAVRLVRSINE